MDKLIWEKIQKKWKVSDSKHIKKDKQYQRKRYQKINSMYIKNHIKPYINVFKDQEVLEIGCNEGIITYEISKYAKSIIGVEPHQTYFDHAIITSQYIEKPCLILNCLAREFAEMNFDDMELNFNSIILTKVLYHFTKEDVDKIVTNIMPRCRLAFVQSKESRGGKKNNPYGLSKWKNIKSWMKDIGFKVTIRDKKSNCVMLMGRK